MEHVDALAEVEVVKAVAARSLGYGRHVLAKASERFRQSAQGRRLAAQLELLDASERVEHEQWDDALERADAAVAFAPEDAAIREQRGKISDALAAKAEHLAEVAAREKRRAERLRLAEDAEKLWVLWEKAEDAPEPIHLTSLRKLMETDRAAVDAEARRSARKERARVAAATAHESVVEWHAPHYSGPHCTKGCPCGNSCISCSKQCHK
jgi:hypothetical protein